MGGQLVLLEQHRVMEVWDYNARAETKCLPPKQRAMRAGAGNGPVLLVLSRQLVNLYWSIHAVLVWELFLVRYNGLRRLHCTVKGGYIRNLRKI